MEDEKSTNDEISAAIKRLNSGADYIYGVDLYKDEVFQNENIRKHVISDQPDSVRGMGANLMGLGSLSNGTGNLQFVPQDESMFYSPKPTIESLNSELKLIEERIESIKKAMIYLAGEQKTKRRKLIKDNE